MRKRSRGFSLIELLTVLAIVFILLAITVPAFDFLSQKSIDQVISSQLLRAISLTRSEALVRGEVITLCKSADQKTCSGRWQDGYIIYSAAAKIIYVFRNPAKSGDLHWRAFPRGRDDLQFLPSGTSRTENGTFWYCPKNAKKPSWAIMISQSGRARILMSNALGEIEVEQGKKLEC